MPNDRDQVREGVGLAAGEPGDDLRRREGARVELPRDLFPVERRGDRRPGDRPQDIRRDGVMAAGVLQDVDVDPVASLRLADLDGRPLGHASATRSASSSAQALASS